MKFLISLLAAAALTSAATPVARQASPSASVRAAIQAVIDDAGALQSAVEGLTSQGQIAGVQAAITNLQNDIDDGAALFATLPALSDTDALGLANLVSPLQTATSDAVDAVIAKKDVIVNLCVGPVAYQTFQNLIPAAQDFADNLQALVSDTYKPVIQSASNNIQASLQRGLAAFEDAQTPPDSCNGGGTTTTTTTTAPPTTGPTTAPTSSTTLVTSTVTTPTTPPTCPTTPPSTTYPTTTTTTTPPTTSTYPTTSPPAGDCYYRRHPRQM